MKPELLKIKVKDDAIHWGNLHTQEYFIKNLNWKYVSKTLGYDVGFKGKYRKTNKGLKYHSGSGTKENNRKLFETLGISPKKFAHMLKGTQYKLWVKGKEELISKLCNVYGHWNSDKIKLLNKNWGVIQQYQEDGLDNLLPLAMYTGRTTKELRKILGKSTWKSFCNNSFYKNKFICNYIGRFPDELDSTFNRLIDVERYWDLLKKASQIPSSIFRCHRLNILDDHTLWAINTLKQKRELTKTDLLATYTHLYTDTKRMSNQLGTSFNGSWSYKKMKEMHDKYSVMIQTKKYPDEFIECLRDIPVKEYSQYEYTAKLLKTPLEIALQGQNQHHCVGSYINAVKEGGYLVYNIIDNTNETISTLGVNVKFTGKYIDTPPETGCYEISGISTTYTSISQIQERIFTFSQHYKAFNKPVSNLVNHFSLGYDQRCVATQINPLERLADDLIKKLNKEQYEDKKS